MKITIRLYSVICCHHFALSLDCGISASAALLAACCARFSLACMLKTPPVPHGLPDFRPNDVQAACWAADAVPVPVPGKAVELCGKARLKTDCSVASWRASSPEIRP